VRSETSAFDKWPVREQGATSGANAQNLRALYGTAEARVLSKHSAKYATNLRESTLVSLALTTARLADTVDLEGMPRRRETMPSAHVLFDALDFGREELHRASTFGAYHVVMAAPVVLMLVARHAVMKFDCARKSTFGE
jgi:hypothetical protein